MQLGSRAASARRARSDGVRTRPSRRARLVERIRIEPCATTCRGHRFRLEIVFETDGASNLSLDAFLVDAVHPASWRWPRLHHFHGVTLPQRGGTVSHRVWNCSRAVARVGHLLLRRDDGAGQRGLGSLRREPHRVRCRRRPIRAACRGTSVSTWATVRWRCRSRVRRRSPATASPPRPAIERSLDVRR